MKVFVKMTFLGQFQRFMAAYVTFTGRNEHGIRCIRFFAASFFILTALDFPTIGFGFLSFTPLSLSLSLSLSLLLLLLLLLLSSKPSLQKL